MLFKKLKFFRTNNVLWLKNKNISNVNAIDDVNRVENDPALRLDIDVGRLSEVDVRSRDQSFRYGELLLCRIINSLRNSEKQSVRLVKLEKNGVFRTRQMEIFHEHIVNKSRFLNEHKFNLSFNLKYARVDFKRVSLYEFVCLKDQLAVSSHFSIITLVPLLLEMEKSSRVMECGTGSGSMTLFLSERLGADGILHTFEIGEAKALRAKHHFKVWKESYDLTVDDEAKRWPKNVLYGCLDICSPEAVKLEQTLANFYDSIYLDMANIHMALERSYKLLKIGGVLVVNTMQLTQVLKCLNEIDRKRLPLEKELIIEPSNRFWEMRKFNTNQKLDQTYESLNWVTRLEDRFSEKYKRGGLFFNYWQGYLVKFRKIK